MGKIPKSFTVTLGGKTLRFKYDVDWTGEGYYYDGEDMEYVELGFNWRFLRKQTEHESNPIFRCQFTCHPFGKTTWFSTHLKQVYYDPFYDFPSVESAIVGFKGFLRDNYVSKRASPKKKANMPFGL